MNFDILKKSYLFYNIPEDEIMPILSELQAREVVYKNGDIIFPVGHEADGVGLVLTGAVLFTHTDIHGHHTIFERIEPGEIFEEAHAFAQEKILIVDMVATKTTTILFFNIDRLLYLFENTSNKAYQQLVYNLLKLLSIKVLDLKKKIKYTSPKSIRDRVLTYLYDMSELHQSDTFDIPFNRQEMADYLNVDRSSLSAELIKMQQEDILTYEKNHFTLLLNKEDFYQ